MLGVAAQRATLRVGTQRATLRVVDGDANRKTVGLKEIQSLMPKNVLCVGHCSADQAVLTRFLATHFDVLVQSASFADTATTRIQKGDVDLVLVNRVFDADGGSGLDFIQRLKSDPVSRDVPVMLISNYPEFQTEAVAAGALAGFGKSDYDQPHSVDQLAHILPKRRQEHAANVPP
jgi:PleD family two-component response regulator